MNEHETIKFVCTDPAGTCHVCGKDGAAGERWVNADTCDVCSYLQSSIKWGGSMARAHREELRQRIAGGKKGVWL